MSRQDVDRASPYLQLKGCDRASDAGGQMTGLARGARRGATDIATSAHSSWAFARLLTRQPTDMWCSRIATGSSPRVSEPSEASAAWPSHVQKAGRQGHFRERLRLTFRSPSCRSTRESHTAAHTVADQDESNSTFYAIVIGALETKIPPCWRARFCAIQCDRNSQPLVPVSSPHGGYPHTSRSCGVFNPALIASCALA